MSNPTDQTPSDSRPTESSSAGSEVELFVDDVLDPSEEESFDDLKTLNIGDESTHVPESNKEEEEYDLLTTLEMPVFRLPGAIRPLATKAAAPGAGATEEEEDPQVPLSGILRKRRKLPTVKSDSGPPVGGAELLPHIVVRQPPTVDLKWRTDLPGSNGAGKPVLQAPAEAIAAVTAQADAASANGAAATAAAATTGAPPPPKDAAGRAADKATKANPPKPPKLAPPVKGKAKPPPPKPPASVARAEPGPDKPARPRHQAPKIARQEDGEDLTGLVQELIEEDTPKKTLERPLEPAWYQQIFTEEYFRTLPMGFHKQTLREAQFVVDSLGVGDGGRILDLCCGFGRHTLDLAKRGYDMVGLDLSLPLLQKALGEAQRRKLSIKFIHGDIRELNFQEVFDATYCWHTSFGYFDDKTNFEVLRGVHRALKPGGRFLLEIVNRDFIVGLMPRRKWWEGADCLFLEEIAFNYNTSVLHTKRSFIYDDGRPPWEQNIYIRLYSLHELQNLLRLGGFNVLDVSGQIQTRGFYLGQASPNIILLAEKR